MNKDLAAAVLKLLYPLALMLMVAALAYRSGIQTASKQAAAEKAGIIATYQAAALSAEQQYSTALAEAAAEKQKWFDFAQAQSAKLAKAVQAIDAEQGRLKQEIPDAIKRDENAGDCRSGLGADSLRLYNRAHGYAD
ncbi:hypothetical protein LVJ83_04875 [Uruburuella testudinis]|uniref:Phage associated protein n=1 Tax=Uruburuella testudinis TaxID=1282863 RepID=A0ABY4DUT4_9NEIS|nr:hypothetical protein [Uruburuella testudinis]UOO82801.1 hypothetical protein LVJ83_04875 [Uruburuella testudinis]